MKYSIIVREHDSDHDVELLQVNGNPEAIVKALRGKKLTMRASIFKSGPRRFQIPKYSQIRIVENE
jgi:hypothetical protein